MFWGGGNFRLSHPRLYKWLISNIKAFFIGGAISFVVTVSATVILHSRQVRYKNDKSVEQAINELYEKAEISELIFSDINGNIYRRVEYIESTGNQWINTGILFDSNKTYNITAEMSFTNVNNNQLTGWDYGGAFGVNDGKFYSGWGSNGSVDLNTYYKINLIISSTSILSVDDNVIISRPNGSLGTYNEGVSYPIFVMVKGSNYSHYVRAKLKNMSIIADNNIVRDYLTVLDEQKRPCLFDKVSRTCFYNQGTGEFLYE